MLTYQDWVECKDSSRIDFIKNAITQHKASKDYKMAKNADEYFRRHNPTIAQFVKMLYTVSGPIEDITSANYKLKSNFFNRLITQLNQFLLGNGVTFKDQTTKKKLGEDFDDKLQDAGEKALCHKVSYGFWNLDHIEIFSLLEFVPFEDEENGALRAGIRFWQLDDQHPLRATVYEEDGYTDYIWRVKDREGKKAKPEGEILAPKRSYIQKTRGTVADGMEIYEGTNYPTFPIVPFWGNKLHQSELDGMREDIDCYDLIRSGFASDIDEAQEIYWVIKNAGGMDDVDLADFIDKLKRNKAVNLEDGQEIDAQTVEVPYQARESMLTRLRSDIYEDFMALDTKNIADGAVTATQIKAGYEPMNEKADKYEYCVTAFIKGILEIAGINDIPTYTRSVIVNEGETITNLIAAAQYLPAEYITKKIVTVFGDGDHLDEILKMMDGEDMERFGAKDEEEQSEEQNNDQNEEQDVNNAE